ncbi:MAG: hypothetical protein ACREBG_17710 [Pyrinomonadaceae bacterium]
MSVTSICIAAFLAVLGFILAIIVIWLVAKPDAGSYLTAKETLEEFRKEPRLAIKVFIILLYLPRFLGKGLLGAVLALSVAAFACLSAICESGTVESLRVVRDMLRDLYTFVEHLVAKS